MDNKGKVGLVLSGGGAKGAYQVGVLRALEEFGMNVHMVSGASIGALNGGILAGAPSFSEGVSRVESLWRMLAKASPLKVSSLVYIKLMVAAGSVVLPQAKLLMLALNLKESSLLSEEPLIELMDKYLNTDGLTQGLPLYISVYKSLGAMKDISRCVLAAANLRDTPDSDFLHLQSLPRREQRNALLASAALPMLFKAQKINNQKYTDGGQGGWSTSQGNTPIQPLIDAGCNMVLVTHLSDGSFWNRHDFPNTTIIEIRPQNTIARDTGILGGAKDLLGFDATKIPSWIEQGYRDTIHCVGRIKNTLDSFDTLNKSRINITNSFNANVEADENLSHVMAKIRKRR